MPREQWMWRDWVIDALNRDLPYDQFLIEQLAGDLLPGRDAAADHRHRISAQQHDQRGRGDRPRAVPHGRKCSIASTASAKPCWA